MIIYIRQVITLLIYQLITFSSIPVFLHLTDLFASYYISAIVYRFNNLITINKKKLPAILTVAKRLRKWTKLFLES